MLTPYPLTKKVNEILLLMDLEIRVSDLYSNSLFEKEDLAKFARWVGDELAVNAKLIHCKEAEGFKHLTLELLYEKTYSTVQQVRYIKHWPCRTDILGKYFRVTNELSARLLRSQMRLVQ